MEFVTDTTELVKADTFVPDAPAISGPLADCEQPEAVNKTPAKETQAWPERENKNIPRNLPILR